MAASIRLLPQKFSRVIPSYARHMRPRNRVAVQQYPHNCRFCSNTAADSRPWQLMSSVCVERYPVISQPLTALEQEYREVCDALELESSVLSDHEVQVIKDRDRVQKRKEGKLDDDGDDDTDVLTALDIEDLANEKLNEFQPAPLETEADMKKDTRSTNRRLSDKLVLLVQEKIGDDLLWMLPQGKREEGETMRETAERVLNSCTEENRMKVKFLGNAPVGVYKYRYPQEVQERVGAQGAKVFFFKAKLLQGDYKSRPDTEIKDHRWLTREELDSVLQSRYSESIKKFVLPVTW